MENAGGSKQEGGRMKDIRLIAVLLPIIACGQVDDRTDPVVKRQSSLGSEIILYETAQSTVVQDGDWIRWRFIDKLSDSPEQLVYRGTRGEQGGCVFNRSGSSKGAVQDVVIIERTIAVNMNQCLMESERATLLESDAVARGLLPVEETKAGDQFTGAAQAGGSELQLQTAGNFSGSYRTLLQDILGITTTAVRSNVDWSTNGSCMLGWHRWWDWYKLTGSGWSIGTNGERGTTSGTLPCNDIWQQSWAFFSNWFFCGFTPTFADHADVQFHAFSDGTSSYSSSTNWYGACYWLLHFTDAYDPN
jgi:hypothetical protein